MATMSGIIPAIQSHLTVLSVLAASNPGSQSGCHSQKEIISSLAPDCSFLPNTPPNLTKSLTLVRRLAATAVLLLVLF